MKVYHVTISVTNNKKENLKLPQKTHKQSYCLSGIIQTLTQVAEDIVLCGLGTLGMTDQANILFFLLQCSWGFFTYNC